MKPIIYIFCLSLSCFADNVSIDLGSYSTDFKFSGSKVKVVSDNGELTEIFNQYCSSRTNENILSLFDVESQSQLVSILNDVEKGKAYRSALASTDTMKPLFGIFKNEKEVQVIVEITLKSRRKFFQISYLKKYEGKYFLVFMQSQFNSPESMLVDTLNRDPKAVDSFKITSD